VWCSGGTRRPKRLWKERGGLRLYRRRSEAAKPLMGELGGRKQTSPARCFYREKVLLEKRGFGRHAQAALIHFLLHPRILRQPGL
jgi:hypothetical protein